MKGLRLKIKEGQEVVIGLREDATPTVAALLESLPITSRANRWGDEVYFDVPFHSALEGDARREMSVGEVAYWPDGDALAVFFGPTPISTSTAPKAYSPCNLVGHVVGDSRGLGRVKAGAMLELLRE